MVEDYLSLVKEIFLHPDAMMENIIRITFHGIGVEPRQDADL
jgi:hypothetical protein